MLIGFFLKEEILPKQCFFPNNNDDKMKNQNI